MGTININIDNDFKIYVKNYIDKYNKVNCPDRMTMTQLIRIALKEYVENHKLETE